MSARIWDEFLSDRDREHARRMSPPPAIGFGQQPALILIDNYRAGLGDRPRELLDAMDEYPINMGLEAWQAVAETKPLLEQCRRLGVPVIHSNMDVAPHTPWDMYSALRLAPETATRRSVRNDKYDPGADADIWQIHPDLAPADDEVLIRKLAPSVFFGTPLLSVLQGLGVDTLLVTGNSTSGCVRASVVDAASYRYRVTVVEECVYDRTQAAHAINLFDMHQKYADVLPVAEVSRWLETWAADHAS